MFQLQIKNPSAEERFFLCEKEKLILIGARELDSLTELDIRNISYHNWQIPTVFPQFTSLFMVT